MSPTDALQVIYWAALASAVALLIGLALRRWRSAGQASGALAIAAGYIAAELAWRGVPPLAPVDATERLPHIALVIGIIGAIRAAAGRTVWMLIITGLVLAGSVILLLGPALQWRGAGFMSATSVLLAAASVGVVHILNRKAGWMAPTWANPVVLCLACLGGAMALAQSFSASLALLAGGLAGALGSVAVLSLLWPRMGAGAGANPAAGVLLILLLMAGWLYAALPLPSAILLTAAALIPALLTSPVVRTRKAGVRIAMGLLAVLVLSAAAVWLTPAGFDFSP